MSASWSLPRPLREALLAPLQRTIVHADRSVDLAPAVAAVIAQVVSADGGSSVLLALVDEGDFVARVRSWLPSMPRTRRAEWLVERLAAEAGATWAEAAVDPPGPITLPAAARAGLHGLLDRLAAHTRTEEDEEPSPERYAEALLGALGRLALEHPPLAARIAARRIPDGDRAGGAHRLPEALAARRIASPERLLKFLDRALDLRWA